MTAAWYMATNTLLFTFYMGGCALAFLLCQRDKLAREQVFAYAITILVFKVITDSINVGQGGPTALFHFWWYLINAGVDFYILVYARNLWAPASRWIFRIGILAISLDVAYFVGAATAHRLPGFPYFIISNGLEALQVLALIMFSGPVGVVRQIPHRIARLVIGIFRPTRRQEQVIGHT